MFFNTAWISLKYTSHDRKACMVCFFFRSAEKETDEVKIHFRHLYNHQHSIKYATAFYFTNKHNIHSSIMEQILKKSTFNTLTLDIHYSWHKANAGHGNCVINDVVAPGVVWKATWFGENSQHKMSKVKRKHPLTLQSFSHTV